MAAPTLTSTSTMSPRSTSWAMASIEEAMAVPGGRVRIGRRPATSPDDSISGGSKGNRGPVLTINCEGEMECPTAKSSAASTQVFSTVMRAFLEAGMLWPCS